MLAVCGLLKTVGSVCTPYHSTSPSWIISLLCCPLTLFTSLFTVLPTVLFSSYPYRLIVFPFFLSVISSLSVFYSQCTFFKPSIIFVFHLPIFVWAVQESIVLLVSHCKQNRKCFVVRTTFMWCLWYIILCGFTGRTWFMWCLWYIILYGLILKYFAVHKFCLNEIHLGIDLAKSSEVVKIVLMAVFCGKHVSMECQYQCPFGLCLILSLLPPAPPSFIIITPWNDTWHRQRSIWKFGLWTN
jgi:hypothetical protein